MRIENELNRIEHNMRLTKNHKLKDLRRKKQQERSCVSVNPIQVRPFYRLKVQGGSLGTPL